MISLRKYLDQTQSEAAPAARLSVGQLLDAAIAAYRSSLRAIGAASLSACPGLGNELQQSLGGVEASLTPPVTGAAISQAETAVSEQLARWGSRAAQQAQTRTEEVKEMLIVMARTAESVGERDQRCAGQITEITARFRKIANLEDLRQIRASIEESAAELKTSIDRMADEGKAAIASLKSELSTYQAKLEAAEQMASRDSLTGLRNRLWVERHIARRVAEEKQFCVAVIDLNDFKRVNDEHGHLAGDEVLRQFATELQSASRSTDIVGRWGGDEFIIVMDGTLAGAKSQVVRLKEWVCGSYSIEGQAGPARLRIDAAIGLAERAPTEPVKDLLARADAAMYADKAGAHAAGPKRTS